MNKDISLTEKTLQKQEYEFFFGTPEEQQAEKLYYAKQKARGQVLIDLCKHVDFPLHKVPEVLLKDF